VEFVDVDGSLGEGGGQILRTAVAFSVIMGRPVRVFNVRAGRGVPGLKRQHVSALQVLNKVFDGRLTGATEGSSEVSFVPGSPKLGSLNIDMGTAASITLVLQAVVPAVALRGAELSMELVGGTDVPWSPTVDYFCCVVREAFASVGIHFDVTSSRRGYYPRGGGKVSATIHPCRSLEPLDLAVLESTSSVSLASRCGMLPKHVAERQLYSAAKVLEESGFHVLEKEATEEASSSPGSSVLAYFSGSGFFLGTDSLGARGKPAEEVGKDAAGRFVGEAKSGAHLDSNLADMLLPLMALAPRPSRARVSGVTPHLRSGLQLAAQFASCRWSEEPEGGSTVVNVVPHGQSLPRRQNV